MLCWKLGPALATGNCIVLKPSEFTPLTALRMCQLIQEAGFPPGVVNIVNGYGNVVGAAISEHPLIRKVAFTGSTAVGRTIAKAAAATNLKVVTLELGGKSPNIIFEDAEVDLAVQWAAFGIFLNHGQTCCAGTRVFVHEKIYDEFIPKFLAHAKTLKVGDPFDPQTFQGPQVSQVQFDRIMGYIEDGKKNATCEMGGERAGDEGVSPPASQIIACADGTPSTHSSLSGQPSFPSENVEIDSIDHPILIQSLAFPALMSNQRSTAKRSSVPSLLSSNSRTKRTSCARPMTPNT